jgi:predicted HTH domain antitoxin
MTVTLKFELPDAALSAVREDPEGFVSEMRLMAAAKWYEIGRVSQGRAAEIAGLGRAAFIEALGRLGTPVFQVTPEELQEELSKCRASGS